MKNLFSRIVIAMGLMLLPTLAYAYMPETDIMIKISRSQVPDEVFVEDFYRDNIPDEYCEAFIYYTKDCPEIRMNFYSIMIVESGNFRWFRNVNKNGSVDLGPSQLNSNNLKNKQFVRAFRPKDESMITSKYCYYMVMTIGYYKDLYNRLGDKYAFYAYNGGDKAARQIKNGETHNESLIKKVKSYDRLVRKQVEIKTQELEEYVKLRRVQHVMSVYEKYYKDIMWKTTELLLSINTIEESTDCLNKLSFNRTSYIFRRKDLFQFESEEVGIDINPEVRTLYNKLMQTYISIAI